MKILASGDIHGDTKLAEALADKAEKENVDLVILAGDITFADQSTKNIIGPFEKAKKQAQARGLTVQKEVGEVNVNIVPGTVVLQSLAVGDYAELNQTIIFTISQ